MIACFAACPGQPCWYLWTSFWISTYGTETILSVGLVTKRAVSQVDIWDDMGETSNLEKFSFLQVCLGGGISHVSLICNSGNLWSISDFLDTRVIKLKFSCLVLAHSCPFTAVKLLCILSTYGLLSCHSGSFSKGG